VHVVDAVNLPDKSNYQVKVFQDNSMSETKVREGTGPIWNEAILFDIFNTKEPVIIQIVSVGVLGGEEIVLENMLSL